MRTNEEIKLNDNIAEFILILEKEIRVLERETREQEEVKNETLERLLSLTEKKEKCAKDEENNSSKIAEIRNKIEEFSEERQKYRGSLVSEHEEIK